MRIGLWFFVFFFLPLMSTTIHADQPNIILINVDDVEAETASDQQTESSLDCAVTGGMPVGGRPTGVDVCDVHTSYRTN